MGQIASRYALNSASLTGSRSSSVGAPHTPQQVFAANMQVPGAEHLPKSTPPELADDGAAVEVAADGAAVEFATPVCPETAPVAPPAASDVDADAPPLPALEPSMTSPPHANTSGAMKETSNLGADARSLTGARQMRPAAHARRKPAVAHDARHCLATAIVARCALSGWDFSLSFVAGSLQLARGNRPRFRPRAPSRRQRARLATDSAESSRRRESSVRRRAPPPRRRSARSKTRTACSLTRTVPRKTTRETSTGSTKSSSSVFASGTRRRSRSRRCRKSASRRPG